jgi:uncharacterized protein
MSAIRENLADLPFTQRYGPWAVVAGASVGLGAEYAAQLARRGLNLLLIARRADLLQALAERLHHEFGVEVRALVQDLADPQAAARIEAAADGLEVGLLVYNAAFSAVGPFLERPVSDHLRELETNQRTPLLLLYAFGERLRVQGHGGVILMSSLSALQGAPYIANYAATKSYLLLLAEGLAEEWRPQGVEVLVCLASAIQTPGYLASLDGKLGGFSAPASEPQAVVTAALGALGRQSVVVPGLGNRLSSFFLRHILPRQAAVRMMGSVLKGMYGKEK